MTRVKQQRPTIDDSQPRRCLKEMLAGLVGDEPNRLMETYYWSQEPGLLEIMRAIAIMPEDARTALEVFLAMSHEPAAIAAHWDGSGRLTLTSPQAGQAIAVIQYCTEHDDVEKPLLPN
jgi:hypothetical protein